MAGRRPKDSGSKLSVETLTHSEATRKNIPTAEYQSVLQREQESPVRVAYERRNRDVDPQLVWRGKDEQDWSDLVVPAPPLYIQEKVHPKVLIDDLLRQTRASAPAVLQQLDLFADFNGIPAGADRTEFYQHDQNWSNRVILGDSLLVMASLAEREGLRGKVQCIYLDPPYGIKFNSNFQWSTTSRDVKDGNPEHITREPEQVKAFRDTWRDGIHSYLTYLRDRLTVARDLLADSGSIFVQIGDENVHRVRAVMDEVFGEENIVAQISFKKTTSLTSEFLSSNFDYLIWFARQRAQAKYRGILVDKGYESDLGFYGYVEEPGGLRRRLSTEEKPDPDAAYSVSDLTSSHDYSVGKKEFVFQGRPFGPGRRFWTTSPAGMSRLAKANRIHESTNSLRFVRFFRDYPVQPLASTWVDTITGQYSDPRVYVVQTATKVIERCVMMTTDPGDLVLDPTCVRRGTRVWVPDGGSAADDAVDEPRRSELARPPFRPPVNGGRPELPPAQAGGLSGPLPVDGEGRGWGRASRNDRGASAPERPPFRPPEVGGRPEGNGQPLVPPPARPTGGPSLAPSPSTGRAGGGGVLVSSTAVPSARLVPIESLRPGAHVLAHDGRPHRVSRVIVKRYRGLMVGLRCAGSATLLWLTADHRVLTRPRPRSLGGCRDWSGSPVAHRARAQALRRAATPPEQRLWDALRGRKLGAKFRRQHPIGPYIADFYSRDAHLVVEVDGATHAEPEAAAYDAERDAYLRALGLEILRFGAEEIERNLGGVCRAIAQQPTLRAESADGAVWMQAGALEPGDLVFVGPDRQAVPLAAVERQATDEEVFDLEVEGAHSFLTEVCTVHNCGSGTTAYVAEQWGRRWITIDTSRVALALARARIMGARYPYYLLADSRDGQLKEAEVTRAAPSTQPVHGQVRQGFVYERVPHITLKSIANNAEIDVIWEKWQATLEPLRSALNAALEQSWQEWEIPREAAAGWPAEARQLHADWWQARIARQREIDASIAARAEYEFLYDKPYEDKRKVRVAGPFTVESLSPHRVLGVDEDGELIDGLAEAGADYGDRQSFPQLILENLRTAGVQQAHKGDKISFTSLTPWPGDLVCAEGRYREGDPETGPERRAAIFIGPEFGTVSRPDLVQAAREAADGGFDLLIACAFNYEAHATELSKLGRLPILKARMNADLHLADDLKNTGKGNLFVIFGEPDVEVVPAGNGQVQVKVNGVDVFHPSTGEVRSDGPEGIACWFIDTDYNEESFFVRHAYFLGANDPYKALKTTLKAEIDEDAWATLHRATSRPFDRPTSGRIAVKVINHLGDEVMKVFRVG